MKKLLLTILLVATFDSYSGNFTINVAETAATEQRKSALQNYFRQIYSSVGIKPSFVFMPSNRGLAAVNAGEIDAEAGRLEQIASQYPNLTKVNAPLATIKVALFCLSKEQCELRENAKIGVQKGFQSAVEFCDQLSEECYFDTNVQSLAKLLERSMLSSLFLVKAESSQVLCNLSSDIIYYVDLPQFSRQTFHYLNNKYRSLAPQLAEAIKQVNAQYKEHFSEDGWKLSLTKCGKVMESADHKA